MPSLRDTVLKDQYSYFANSKLSGLKLDNGVIPFEEHPFSTNLLGHKIPTHRVKSCLQLLIGIGEGSIAFCLSSRSNNMIAMLIKVIPLAVLAGVYVLNLKNAFNENNVLYGLMKFPGSEIVLAGVVTVIGIGINLVNYKRMRNN